MPSSVISVMIYDAPSQLLQVVFRSTGETYQYRDVPLDEWQRFLRAPSKGTYLNHTFKAKNYSFEHFARGAAPHLPRGSMRWPAPEPALSFAATATPR